MQYIEFRCIQNSKSCDSYPAARNAPDELLTPSAVTILLYFTGFCNNVVYSNIQKL